ncbi:hypothetical protein MMC30_000018 [Trapelia coarctata]|nr:hypothetical protein [Trapelia coarctata]
MTEWVGVRSRVKQKGVSWVGDVVSRANQEEVQFVGLLLEGNEGFEGTHTTEAAFSRNTPRSVDQMSGRLRVFQRYCSSQGDLRDNIYGAFGRSVAGIGSKCEYEARGTVYRGPSGRRKVSARESWFKRL